MVELPANTKKELSGFREAGHIEYANLLESIAKYYVENGDDYSFDPDEFLEEIGDFLWGINAGLNDEEE